MVMMQHTYVAIQPNYLYFIVGWVWGVATQNGCGVPLTSLKLTPSVVQEHQLCKNRAQKQCLELPMATSSLTVYTGAYTVATVSGREPLLAPCVH